jgi:hypothetical protein
MSTGVSHLYHCRIVICTIAAYSFAQLPHWHLFHWLIIISTIAPLWPTNLSSSCADHVSSRLVCVSVGRALPSGRMIGEGMGSILILMNAGTMRADV